MLPGKIPKPPVPALPKVVKRLIKILSLSYPAIGLSNINMQNSATVNAI